MYKVIYEYDDRLVLVDMRDGGLLPKGFISNKKMKVISPKIYVYNALKFNPYASEPKERLSKMRFIKVGSFFRAIQKG